MKPVTGSLMRTKYVVYLHKELIDWFNNLHSNVLVPENELVIFLHTGVTPTTEMNPFGYELAEVITTGGRYGWFSLKALRAL